MNNFGRLARDHWAEWLPIRYREIEDPERFFTGLGQEVAAHVEATVAALSVPTGLAAEQVTRWWATARANATSQVLGEMVFLSPEDLEEESEIDPSTSTGAYLAMLVEEREEQQADQAEQDFQDQQAWDTEMAARREGNTAG